MVRLGIGAGLLMGDANPMFFVAGVSLRRYRHFLVVRRPDHMLVLIQIVHHYTSAVPFL